MPKKNTDHTRFIDILDEEIKQLEYRVGQLKARMDDVAGQNFKSEGVTGQSLELTQLKAELKSITKQIDFVKGVKNDYEITMAKEQEAEKRKHLENLFVLAVVTGSISENLRIKMEQERLEQQKKDTLEITQSFEEFYENFDDNDYYFITKDDVKDILKDERILQMAEDDDVTLEVEEADNKAAVENMMDKALAFDSSKGRAYSFADKTRLFLEINRDDNGFYDAYKAICEYEKERIPGIEDNDIYKSKEFQDSDECKKYLEYKKHIEDIKKELKILYKRTEELNKEFDEGTSDLSKGTGFTRELLEQEIKLHHKITELRVKALTDLMEVKDSKSMGIMNQFHLFLRIENPVERTIKRHTVLVRNNEFLEDKEKVEVVRAVNGKKGVGSSSDKSLIEKGLARNKLRRCSNQAKNLGGHVLQFYHYMSNDINTLLDFVFTRQLDKGKSKELSEKEKDSLMHSVAKLVLFNVLINENNSGGTDRYYLEKIKEFTRKNGNDSLDKTTELFYQTDEFQKFIKGFAKKGKFRENILNLLSHDTDKDIALSMKHLKPTVAVAMKK